MAESKEEIIAIIKSPCYLHNKKTIFKNCMTRSEAIERAAKSIHYYEWKHHNNMPKWNELNSDIQNDYSKMAEAALDALLGKEAGNVIH